MFGGSLLAGNGSAPSAFRAAVGTGALAPDRKTASVAQAAIGLDVYEAADVHLRFPAKVTLDQYAGTTYGAAYARKVFLVQLPHARVVSESYLIHEPLRNCGPDAVNRGQRDFKPAIVRHINSRYQRHSVYLALPLLVLRVGGAKYPNYVAPADHLATGAYGLY